MLDNTLSRIRRNHGLEHATIHVLSGRHNGFSAQGNSDHRGFYLNIYGDIAEDDVQRAVHDAHRRMKEGETALAVHPNCGTVLLTTAAMAAVAAQLVFGVEQLRQRRSAFNPTVLINALPSAIMAVVMTLIVSKPVGLAIQEKYTVDGELGELEVVSVKRIAPSPITRFFRMLLAPGRQLEARAYRITTRG
jgi:hypothetical protein